MQLFGATWNQGDGSFGNVSVGTANDDGGQTLPDGIAYAYRYHDAMLGTLLGFPQIFTVVAGLPRSDTSLMMQLLVAAGRAALTDAKRGADADNPLGYLELEKVLNLANDGSWIPEARGQVVRIVVQLLPFLPRNAHYCVVLMERNLNEVISSQRALLARQGRRGAELDEPKLSEMYRAELLRLRKQIAGRPEMRTLAVNYGELLADPTSGIARLARFLGEPFDRNAAVAAVRPDLRRQKR